MFSSFDIISSPVHLNARQNLSSRNEFAWSQTITIKWSGRVQLSVLVAVARNGKWNGMKWEKMKKKERKKKKLLTTFTKCALVSCLFCIKYYWVSEILLCYVYMAKDWKKRQCSNICSTLHSLRVSVCLFVPLNCPISFSSFLLLVLLEHNK